MLRIKNSSSDTMQLCFQPSRTSRCSAVALILQRSFRDTVQSVEPSERQISIDFITRRLGIYRRASRQRRVSHRWSRRIDNRP